MSFYDYSGDYIPPMPVCQVHLGPPGGETNVGPLEALIDSGADVTVIPIAYLNEVKAKRVSRDRVRSLWGDARTVDVYAVAFALDKLRISALQVLADEQGQEIVLGRFVINRLKIVLDGPAAMAEIVV